MSKWSWQTRQVRKDAVPALGDSNPKLHLAPTPEAGISARRPEAAFRAPAMPTAMLDAGFGWSGAGAPSMVTGTVDTAAGRLGDDLPGPRTEVPAGASTTAIHSSDLGDGQFRLLRGRESTDGLTSETELRIREPELMAGSRAALVRGRNPYPENNPDGYRFGARVYRWNNRRMYRPQIVHTARPAPIRTAAMGNASPAPVDGNTGTSPYAFGTFARRRMFIGGPLARRLPEAADYRNLNEDPTPLPASIQFVSV